MCSGVVYAGIYLRFFFFFNDTATTEIYTLPYTTLFRSERGGRDARVGGHVARRQRRIVGRRSGRRRGGQGGDRKSTRLNSSHLVISYAVFCLKKKILPVDRPLHEEAAAHRTDVTCATAA